MSQLNDKKKNARDALPEKEFALRNSLLIDLFENTHIRTIYHMFLALFIGLFINTAANHYINKGEFLAGFRLITIAFGKLNIAIFGWLCLFSTTCLCFGLFKIWANLRINYIPIKSIRIWDRIWLIATIIYYLTSFIVSTWYIEFFGLPTASSSIIAMEQTRLLMKLHAFLRVNVERIIKYKPHSDQDNLKPVKFKQFLYFLFIPTLIYRDEYPRTTKIRKSFVFFRLLEVIGVILCVNFLLERHFNQHDINQFGTKKIKIHEICLEILENSLVGILILLSSFFLILHSWQNMFAELTRFGDRMFYKDWWVCVSYSDWFRTWNIIVYDWLYTYIYKDMCEILTNNNRVLSKLTVFVVSAAVHEWILYCMFGFFFPLLFIEFFLGGLLNFVKAPKKPILNVLFIYGLSIGMSSLMTLYTFEYYAKTKVKIVNPTFWDYLLPRFLTSNCIDF